MPIIYNKQKLIMGFDYGTKYIGVAIGQATTCTARPLDCIVNNKKTVNWLKISEMIQQWKPGTLIVGIPLSKDLKLYSIKIACYNFLHNLISKFELPSFSTDETLTTWEAKKELSYLQQQNLNNKELLHINSKAAAIILEQWLHENS